MKILSLNTWKNEGEYPARLARIADGIAALSPDVALLQECFSSPETGEDTARFIGERLNCAWASSPARFKSRLHRGRPMRTSSGLAILARGSIVDTWTLPLPSSEEGGERLALGATVRCMSGTLRAVCVHFSHVKGETALRAAQIATALAEAARRWGDDWFCVGGDFNCEAVEAEAALRLALDSLSLANCLPSLGCQTPTCSYPLQPDRPGRQIDQIWLASAGGILPEVADGGVAMAGPSGCPPLCPSDHAAVWARLRLPNP